MIAESHPGTVAPLTQPQQAHATPAIDSVILSIPITKITGRGAVESAVIRFQAKASIFRSGYFDSPATRAPRS